jgi:hypothetical protein
MKYIETMSLPSANWVTTVSDPNITVVRYEFVLFDWTND